MHSNTKSRLSVRRWAGIGASFMLAGTTLLMATPSAYANSAASTGSGARATFDSASGIFRLYDTKCDSHPVFLVYKFQGKESRFDYSGGCNTQGGTYKPSLQHGKRITYKACVNVQHWADKCSGESDDLT